MIIRITDEQHKTLAQWGAQQGVSSCDDACHLLLTMLLECTGDPKTRENVSKIANPRPKGWNGVRLYSKYVRIPAFIHSPRTRALWFWGARHGHDNISASFRALVESLPNVWLEGRTTAENVAAFAELAGLDAAAA